MTTKVSELATIYCLPGVQPSTDKTAFATEHYTFSDKIRFVDGFPEKIGGWDLVTFANNMVADGAMRTVFSITVAGRVYTILGTNEKLYVLVGSTLVNITPLLTTTIPIADSLTTDYDTLANNPITTVSGSPTVTVADSNAASYKAGDLITLSGSAAVGGIDAANINKQHIIRTAGASSYTINTGQNASSSTSGGGASVVRASGLITVAAAAHGQANGDRVKIDDAATTGGILDTLINKEHIIRNVTAGTFDIFTTGTATSSVTAGGGASTTYQEEIPEGALNASFGQGYGMGLYGAGLYGVSKLSTSGITYPRIWFADGYGETTILTPGNQGGVYSWAADTQVAPTLVTNAPAAVNYAFVSNNILVTFGAGGVDNQIFTSDQDAITQWTASSTNQVFQDNIEGAGRLMSHVEVGGNNLIFTETHSYTFRYIGLPNVWEIKTKSTEIGIIAPMARCSVNDVAYWMDDTNFYMWNGGNIEIIPSNSDKQSTILTYVYSNLNFAQKSKCFAWYNSEFNEVWFHYPSADSLECDRIARVNLHDYSWVPDTMSRAAAEYPDVLLNAPRLSNYNTSTDQSILYRHEVGSNDNTEPMAWTLTSNLRNASKKDTTVDVGIIPDSIQVGDISLNFSSYLFPQSPNKTYNKTYDITPTTERVTTLLNGRFWKYTWSGSELNQTWRMGEWQEYVQRGATN
jgi:hypothetical protein